MHILPLSLSLSLSLSHPHFLLSLSSGPQAELIKAYYYRGQTP